MANLTTLFLKHLPPPSNLKEGDILNGFLEAMAEKKVDLYPAQEEAILEVMENKNVILNTPTGSGKSLVATAMHFKAIAEGKRSFYTSPIKALVSEKFFALCNEFGPENVGMLTSDASINKEAPILCATAEIMASMALSEGSQAPIDYAIVDEFHYYSDPERGVSWQIPLLTLTNTTFLLMSATLGDSQFISEVLTGLNGQKTAVVKSSDRPVPLDFDYKETPVHETLHALISEHKFPVYVVNFTQRECALQAQNAMSVNICTKEEKKTIQAEFAGFKFDTPYGKDMRRYISHGIGLHHAGLLPKYRLLVEKLAAKGLLKIIMGTDTLGVGVNIPIRTVLFTRLCKFDGQKVGILSIRDFKQISGRAGRKGFDEEGSVVCQAPEHVIENKKAANKFQANDKGKKKKAVKKLPPTKHYVHWDKQIFDKLIEKEPESLQSQFNVSHNMIMTLLLTEPEKTNIQFRKLIQLISVCHETTTNKSKQRKRAAVLLKSLIKAKLIYLEKVDSKNSLVVSEKLQHNFSLHHTLSLYLVHALQFLDQTDEEYALNVLSLVESVVENPRVILLRQIDKIKRLKFAEMKAEGLEYEERIEALDKIEHPKPLSDLIYTTFNEFEAEHPWVSGENIAPKSIAREIIETNASFNEYIKEYELQKSEGILLRYLSSVYKSLVQNIPEEYATETVLEVSAYLRNVLAHTDSSLVEAWENMINPTQNSDPKKEVRIQARLFDPKTNLKAFKAKIRADLHNFLTALAKKEYTDSLHYIRASSNSSWNANKIEESLDPFYQEHQRIVFTPIAKQSEYTIFKKEDETSWNIHQVILDPEEENDWYIKCSVDLDADFKPGEPIICLEHISNQ